MSDSIIVALIMAFSGLVASLASIITNLRSKKQIIRKLDPIQEAQKDVIRQSITKIYYANLPTKTIREFERISLDKLAEGYFALGGNSFIQDIYAEMREWEVIK